MAVLKFKKKKLFYAKIVQFTHNLNFKHSEKNITIVKLFNNCWNIILLLISLIFRHKKITRNY